MRVLGIDPGLTRCGWGVVDGRPGARPEAVGVGVIRSSADLDLELRLLELHTQVTALLREHRPDVVAIERVFTQNNKGTAMGTAQAAGVAALAAAQADRPDRKSTRLNSSHANISYAVFCLKKKPHRNPRHAS